MLISMIVAMAANRVIGAKNGIPWRLPRDQQRFKAITMGKPIVMGRKTHESIGRPLPGRHNIVVTQNPTYQAEGCTVVHSPEAALAAAGEVEEVVIIGGAYLYDYFLPQSGRIYLAILEESFAGDVFFPEFDESEWQTTLTENHEPDGQNAHRYQFLVLERRADGAR
jgi:dihydrofolate reductase